MYIEQQGLLRIPFRLYFSEITIWVACRDDCKVVAVAFCLVNTCLCIVLYFGVLYTNVTRKLNLHLLTLVVQLSLCMEIKNRHHHDLQLQQPYPFKRKRKKNLHNLHKTNGLSDYVHLTEEEKSVSFTK